VRYPDLSDMVEELTAIAQEEMAHFGMVLEKIKARGFSLGHEQKDDYVGQLSKFIRRGGSREGQIVDRLLFAAMIEARSCERFKMLSERISDPDLAEFYRELMISEAGHYTTFLRLARKYGGGIDVDARWQECLDFEAAIIQNYGKKETIHG